MSFSNYYYYFLIKVYQTWLLRLTLLIMFCPVSRNAPNLRRSFSVYDIIFGSSCFCLFQFVLCNSSNTCMEIVAQISSRFYQVYSFTEFLPSNDDCFRFKSWKKYDKDSDQDKDAYQNQLPNQLPPGSNFIRKEWVAKNRAGAKVGKRKTTFTNGESAQLMTAQARFANNGAHP